MDEHVLAAVVADHEAKALLRVEELDGSRGIANRDARRESAAAAATTAAEAAAAPTSTAAEAIAAAAIAATTAAAEAVTATAETAAAAAAEIAVETATKVAVATTALVETTTAGPTPAIVEAHLGKVFRVFIKYERPNTTARQNALRRIKLRQPSPIDEKKPSCEPESINAVADRLRSSGLPAQSGLSRYMAAEQNQNHVTRLVLKP